MKDPALWTALALGVAAGIYWCSFVDWWFARRRKRLETRLREDIAAVLGARLQADTVQRPGGHSN